MKGILQDDLMDHPDVVEQKEQHYHEKEMQIQISDTLDIHLYSSLTPLTAPENPLPALTAFLAKNVF